MRKKISLNELKERYPDTYDVVQDNPDSEPKYLGKLPIEEVIKIPNAVIVHKTPDVSMEPLYMPFAYIDESTTLIAPDLHINDLTPKTLIYPITVAAEYKPDFTDVFKKYNHKIISDLINFNTSVGK